MSSMLFWDHSLQKKNDVWQVAGSNLQIKGRPAIRCIPASLRAPLMGVASLGSGSGDD